MNYKTRQPFPHAAYVEGQRNFTYFDRSLTSGLTDIVIESPGDFLYIDQASTGVVSVELNMRQGGTLAPILLAAGGSIECDFSSFKINATAQLNKTVRVIVGNGARIKGGANVNASSMSVSVVDGGLDRTRANKAFSAYTAASAGGGLYPYIQLYNPANSGKNAIVKSLSVNMSAAGIIGVKTYDTQLTNLVGAPVSKYLGGAASSMQIRNEGNASGSIGSNTMDANYIGASVVLERNYTEPILIAPGKGLLINGSVLAATLLATIQFFEE